MPYFEALTYVQLGEGPVQLDHRAVPASPRLLDPEKSGSVAVSRAETASARPAEAAGPAGLDGERDVVRVVIPDGDRRDAGADLEKRTKKKDF